MAGKLSAGKSKRKMKCVNGKLVVSRLCEYRDLANSTILSFKDELRNTSVIFVKITFGKSHRID